MNRMSTSIRSGTNLLLVSLGLTAVVHGELLPDARRVDWAANVAVGVPGGIQHRTRLIDVTQAPYNADNSGAQNASLAIQAAVKSASYGDAVFLPAGIYRLDTTIYIGADKDGVTVRGAGMEATILDVRTNMAFSVGSGSDYKWTWPTSENVVLDGLVKGSSTVTLGSTSAFSVGQVINIAFDNLVSDSLIEAGYVPTVSVGGFGLLRKQKARVTAKTSTSLSFFPPLYYVPPPGLAARVNVARQQADFVGIEDLTIDGANGATNFPIMFEQCYGSWIEGVKVVNTKNYGVYLTNCLNCEIRKCVIRDRKTGGTNGAGVLVGSVSACLIEDNIVLNIFPAIEVTYSSTGNVFAYNVLENSIGGTLNTNHAPHNSFNLYEGNVTPNIQSDGYFGGASDDTLFRNWIHGTNLTRSFRTFRVSLNRFTRNYSIIGNIIGETGMTVGAPYSFGNPNMGNASFTGSCEPSSGRFWKDWNSRAVLSKRESDTAGTLTMKSGDFYVGQLIYLVWENGNSRIQLSVGSKSGNIIVFANGIGNVLPMENTEFEVYTGPSGYQELDGDVQKTTIVKANYNFLDRAIPANERLTNESLPASLFRNAKPPYFGSLPWPAFDPLNPNPSFASIPAGYRYANGSAVPGTETGSPPVAPSSLQVQGQ